MSFIQDHLAEISYTHTPSLFLSLPLELRDHIYYYLLSSASTQVPTSPDDGYLRHTRRCIPRLCYGNTNTIYYKHHSYSSASALLCTSHQLHDEVREAVLFHNRLRSKGIIYRLDIMLRSEDKDFGLYSTWLSIPAPVQYMQHLEIGLRWFNKPKEQL